MCCIGLFLDRRFLQPRLESSHLCHLSACCGLLSDVSFCLFPWKVHYTLNIKYSVVAASNQYSLLYLFGFIFIIIILFYFICMQKNKAKADLSTVSGDVFAFSSRVELPSSILHHIAKVASVCHKLKGLALFLSWCKQGEPNPQPVFCKHEISLSNLHDSDY